MEQRVGYPVGTQCNRFYNDLSGPKTLLKRDVINRCLVVFSMKCFMTSQSKASFSASKGEIHHFQPNYAVKLLHMIFSTFKDNAIVYSLKSGLKIQGGLASVLRAALGEH